VHLSHGDGLVFLSWQDSESGMVKKIKHLLATADRLDL
jgi:hypothetical protein